jgi:hypothetical protein
VLPKAMKESRASECVCVLSGSGSGRVGRGVCGEGRGYFTILTSVKGKKPR